MQKARLSNDGRIILKIGGLRFQENIALIKSIPGRTYDGKTKEWAIPYTEENVLLLNKEAFNLTPDLAKDILEPPLDGWKDEPFPNLQLVEPYALRRYQLDALRYIKWHGYRGVWGLPMGSGKTLISLALIKTIEDSLPALVMSPAPVKSTFLKDHKKFFGNTTEIEILKGDMSIDQCTEKKIYVVNYELLSRAIETVQKPYIDAKGRKQVRDVCLPSRQFRRFLRSGFRTIIADEVHRLKNNETKVYYAWKTLASHARYVIGMTGTPILSRPSELLSYWKVMKPYTWQTDEDFFIRHCEPRQIYLGKSRRITKYDGASNLLELNRKLYNNGMLFFDKKTILPDLPDEPIRTVVPIDLDNFQAYLDEKDAVLDLIAENPSLGLTVFERLKQASVKHKMNQVYSFLRNLAENEDKIVVFAEHQETIRLLHEEFPNSVVFNGTITSARKEKNKQKFIEDDKIQFIFGNTTSMGTGVDGLQESGACTLVFIEFPWTPGEIDQAEARLWRDGFNGEKGIISYYLVGEGTIEDELIERLDTKKSVTEAVNKGREAEEEELLVYLKEKYRKEAEARKKERSAV